MNTDETKQDQTRGSVGAESARAQIDAARRELVRVRALARRLVLARALCWILAGVLGGVLVGVLSDFVLRFPSAGRVIGLSIAAVATAYFLVRGVRQALAFAPTITQLALRLEGRTPGARGRLASGLELAEAGDASDDASRQMLGRALSEGAASFDRRAARSLIQPRRTMHAGLALAGVLGVVAGLSAWRPDLARTGATRILAPWAGAEWPKRFVVVDATGLAVHPSDMDIPLRALVTRTTRPIGRTGVRAHYRVLDSEGRPLGETTSVVLASQRREGASGEARGELYERLIEPALPGPDGGAREHTLEYWFQTEDDRTRVTRVRLVDPPSVIAIEADVTPPAYAVGLTEALVAGPVSLDPAAAAGSVGPVLGGSDVTLRLTFNKGVAPAPGGVQVRAQGGQDPAFEVDASGDCLEIRMRLELSVRATVDVVDEHGLALRDEAAVVLEAVEDRAPTASVTTPARDDTVLATATIDLVGEGRDDLALEWVSLERLIARPPSGSEGAPGEESGEAIEIARREFAVGRAARDASVGAALDLSALGLRPNDEVHVYALAKDAYTDADAGREATRSPARVLRIISESELIDQIRGELGGVRRSAMQIDELQEGLSAALGEQGATPELERQQEALTQRLIEQRRVVERLARRQAVNGLSDQTLSGILDEARGMLERGAQASARASERVGGSIDEEDPARAQELREEGERAQERVREELGALVSLLDRGEDGWLVRREVQRLLDEQRRLREETARVGQNTIGREVGELTPDERTELERIAERQREAAQRAREAMDELGERSRQMSRVDPAQSEAMGEAAQAGRESGIDRKQEQAAEQVGQNQTSAANQTQDEVIEALEEMLEELDSAGQNRDSALRRVLASLIESIEALIVQQERELADLAGAGDDLAGLDEDLVRLDRNTVGVIGQVEDGPGELRPVGDLLGDSLTHQRAAIDSLRGGAADGARVEAEERESLRLLREAKAEAERLENEASNRDQQRQRAELRQAYRQALEEQVALAGEAQPLVDQQLSRRERATVRGMGARQQTLRERLAGLLSGSEGLAESITFGATHEALDTYMRGATDTLSRGEVDTGVVRDQQLSIGMLQMLVEALGQGESQAQDFQDGGGGGGGGGQQQAQQDEPLIPPLAELVLLRGLQGQVAELTRRSDETRGAGGIDSELLGRMQRGLATQAAELIRKMNEPPPGQDGMNGLDIEDGGAGS